MSVALLVVGIIVVIVNLCKDAKGDAECGRHAQQIGFVGEDYEKGLVVCNG